MSYTVYLVFKLTTLCCVTSEDGIGVTEIRYSTILTTYDSFTIFGVTCFKNRSQ